MSLQTHKSFVRLRNTISDILDEGREACDCHIDCQTINTVKAQKSVVRLTHNSVRRLRPADILQNAATVMQMRWIVK